jgi:small subunit ribosomal protein S8
MDPIADMLTTIRNAQAVLKETVVVPYSEIKFEIAKVLKKENFIEEIEKKGKKVRKTIKIKLKYKDKEPAISWLKRVSKPGQRIYTAAGNIKGVKGGHGIAIISTSKGLMTDKEAKKQNLGGEILCKIW